MLYYKVKPEYDNKQRTKWSKQKRRYIPDSIWIANELYTPSEIKTYYVPDDLTEKVYIKKTDTYYFFGARFAKDNTPSNTTRETKLKKPKFNTPFIDDSAKMLDFLYLSKEDFLQSYSYLTEDEYNATVDAILRAIYPND